MARRNSFGGYEQERFQPRDVDTRLECGICLKVLKDPMQCPNQHYFCHSCIQKCLREISQACPTCQHHLTEETLTRAPRILMEMLQGLMIRCDYDNRGCQEIIKLEFLDRHVQSCGYSPTRCSNAGCKEVINRHDKQRHELELCQFRKIDCDECGEQVIWKSSRVHSCFMRKEMDELTRRLNVVQYNMNVVQNDVNDVKSEVSQVRLTQAEMAYLTKEATQRSEWLTGRRKIFVCGGWDGKNSLNSVESYCWPENSWTQEQPMNEERVGASAIVYDDEIYVTGGWNRTAPTNSIEKLKVYSKGMQWNKSAIKMPINSSGHRMVCYEDSAILTGGRIDEGNISDGIYAVSLNSSHNTKLLTQMPEPRYYHGCEIIDDQVIMAGGRTLKFVKNTKNTVYVYDLRKNELKTLPPLPFAVTEMATVSYKGNIVLIGGVNVKGETLNTVAMYDIKTGQIKMLPCLNHKRSSSAAVIAGNVIIVMGGYDYQTKTSLDSVECLDLNTNVWRELSPMKIQRSYAAAILKTNS